MGYGGARPGAGRKKGDVGKSTLEARCLRDELVKQGRKSRKEVAAALIAKAKAGDVSAIKEFYDRTVGKAIETSRVEMEVTMVLDI